MKKLLITILFLMVLVPRMSHAADISFTAEKNTFAKGEDFLVEVFIDTKDASINALEGQVLFRDESLELKEVRDGNSSINFWIEKPQLGSSGKIVFSGITTGGFSGSHRFVFGLVFHAKAVSTGSITLYGIQVLQNDGLGTKVATKVSPFNFSITNSKGGGELTPSVSDTNPPEDFTPFIGRDETLYDGKYFVVFSTTDKGVGIDHYEVREGFFGTYEVTASPYLLKDQSLTKSVYVKAVDKSKNERVVKIRAQKWSLALKIGLILGIILVICILLTRRTRRKFFTR